MSNVLVLDDRQVDYLERLLTIEGYEAEFEDRHIDGDVDVAHDIIDLIEKR